LECALRHETWLLLTYGIGVSAISARRKSI